MSNDINGQQRTITATQVLQQHIATHDHTHTPHTNKQTHWKESWQASPNYQAFWQPQLPSAHLA